MEQREEKTIEGAVCKRVGKKGREAQLYISSTQSRKQKRPVGVEAGSRTELLRELGKPSCKVAAEKNQERASCL